MEFSLLIEAICQGGGAGGFTGASSAGHLQPASFCSCWGGRLPWSGSDPRDLSACRGGAGSACTRTTPAQHVPTARVRSSTCRQQQGPLPGLGQPVADRAVAVTDLLSPQTCPHRRAAAAVGTFASHRAPRPSCSGKAHLVRKGPDSPSVGLLPAGLPSRWTRIDSATTEGAEAWRRWRGCLHSGRGRPAPCPRGVWFAQARTRARERSLRGRGAAPGLVIENYLFMTR